MNSSFQTRLAAFIASATVTSVLLLAIAAGAYPAHDGDRQMAQRSGVDSPR